MAASLERWSEHPLGAAIVRAAGSRGLPLAAPDDFTSLSGKGVSGQIQGRKVLVGNRQLMLDDGIDIAGIEDDAERLRQDGATAVFVAVDTAAAGIIAIADPIKTSAAEAISALKADAVHVIMLTGDHAFTAGVIAKQLSIDAVDAEVQPDRKAEVVARLRREGRVVAMAGDGVNDAPALAAADVGIAMGTGTDVAMECAGITLMKGDLTGIVRARALSRAVMTNIRQNLFFAFVYNAVGVLVAAGALYPAFGILLSPIIAAAAMSLSSVSVITNALRLQAMKL
jgi:Cu+-exporting ATPase